MGDLLLFRTRLHPGADRLAPLDQVAVRSEIEAAAQAALDQADHLIAILDAIDGSTDNEDGGDAEPSLGATEGYESQIVWLRGSDTDHELSP